MTESIEKSVRPARFPSQYGAPGRREDLLPWSFAEDRLRAAPNYWLASVSPSGEPHVRPVDGVWVEEALCFGGSPQTLWVRNIEANPAITVHLGGNLEVVILEGKAEYVTDPADPLTRPSTEASRAKYPQYYSDSGTPPFRPFWALRPRRVYAWVLDQFPHSATCWELGS